MPEGGWMALFFAVGGVGVAALLGPIGKALARRIAGRGAVDPTTGLTTGEMAAERIADLESRLHDLEAAHTRMVELEERLEFAERMLAQGSGPAQLPPAAGSGTTS